MIAFGRVELMWRKWSGPFFQTAYMAGGWLRCFYVGRLRIGWMLRTPNKAAWDAQPTTTLERAEKELT